VRQVWEDLLAHFAGRFPPFVEWADVVEAAGSSHTPSALSLDGLTCSKGGALSDAQLLLALTHLHHCGLLLLPHARTQRPPVLRPHAAELTGAAFVSPWGEDGDATTGPWVVLQQQWLADALDCLSAPKVCL
jgi:hypothetical protein